MLIVFLQIFWCPPRRTETLIPTCLLAYELTRMRTTVWNSLSYLAIHFMFTRLNFNLSCELEGLEPDSDTLKIPEKEADIKRPGSAAIRIHWMVFFIILLSFIISFYYTENLSENQDILNRVYSGSFYSFKHCLSIHQPKILFVTLI